MTNRNTSATTAAGIALAVVLGAVALGYGFLSNMTTEAEISSMSASLSAQGVRVSSMSASLISQGMQVSSMSASLSSQGEEIGGVQSSTALLQANITNLQAELNSLSAQLSSERASDSAALQRLSAEVQSLNATIQTLSSELSALTEPVLLQESQSTCSYVCSGGSANVTFSSDVRGGDMLVVTVVSDDLTNLVVTDSLGTRISLAVSATASPLCTSNTGTCQADIYWGPVRSAGPDSVLVTEGGSTRALRVQAWEFSGVNAVESTVSCAPRCASTSYPASAVLIATARDVSGAGPGFVWSPYSASSVAGTEYQVTMGSGSTTFPFSTGVNDVEVGAVLVRTA